MEAPLHTVFIIANKTTYLITVKVHTEIIHKH